MDLRTEFDAAFTRQIDDPEHGITITALKGGKVRVQYEGDAGQAGGPATVFWMEGGKVHGKSGRIKKVFASVEAAADWNPEDEYC